MPASYRPGDPGACEVGDEVAEGTWNSGRDLTTLWTTPQPSGTSTIAQATAIRSGEDFFAVGSMISVRLDSGW